MSGEPTEHVHEMACMEIWGGNRAISDAISTPGIDAWVYSRPFEGDAAGGDVHYVSMCAAGKVARFLLADVSGHGEAVSSFAMSLRKLMRKHINTPDQTRFTRSLNDDLSRDAEGGMFATAVLASYFAPTDHLILCNAGHPRPLWWRAETRRWQALTHDIEQAEQSAANLPLGIIEPTEYHQFAVRLGVGDRVLLYTDSLIEARADDGKLLGEAGLLNLVQEVGEGADDAVFIERLIERVRAHARGAEFNDDVTAILLSHNGADPPRQSLGEKLRLLARMMGIGE